MMLPPSAWWFAVSVWAAIGCGLHMLASILARDEEKEHRHAVLGILLLIVVMIAAGHQ